MTQNKYENKLNSEKNREWKKKSNNHCYQQKGR